MTNAEENKEQGTDIEQELIRVGNNCFIKIMDQRFLVEVLEVGERSIHVSFPGRDYPVEGMSADLEFHGKHGYTCYHTQITLGPVKSGGGLVLERSPGGIKMYKHRDSWRVPTDFSVKLNLDSEPGEHEAPMLNISAGGVMLRTELELDFASELLLTIPLPGEKVFSVRGKVVHISEMSGDLQNCTARFIGVRFMETDAETSRSITHYVWRRVRQLYPDQLRALYPRGKDV